MKKKPLLFALLALAIVTSLTAGTLAIYTRTLDLNAGIEIKKFAFSAKGGVVGESKTIKLAPTESMTYEFSITNKDTDGGISEVALNYNISVDFSDAFKNMPGLTAVLKKGTVTLATANDGKISYDNKDEERLPAGRENEQSFDVVLTWGDATNIAHTEAGLKTPLTGGLNIVVTAKQAISSLAQDTDNN